MSRQKKVILNESEMPTHWYNLNADLPAAGVELSPPLHPGTGQPIGPDDLAPLFPMSLILQEVSAERYIEIPEPVQDVYRIWRPTPLIRAHEWEKALDTPARIYYKYEGVSPSGSHKPNTAVPTAFYNKEEGVSRLAPETGAGQWGSALSCACQVFGVECKVYMVRVSYEQKPYRKVRMETWGAEVVPSPSPDTNFGQLIGWSTNSGSISPPMEVPNTTFAKYSSTSARRKFGVARPMKPRKVRAWSPALYWCVAE